MTPTSPQVTVARSQDAAAPGLIVTIQLGQEGYPGINIKPGAPLNLAAFGHVEARLVNIGTKPISITLRVDNAGDWHDNPWNTESVYLQPGVSGTVTTIFGYQYGKQPGYKLNRAAIVNLMLFAGKSDTVQSFRIESVTAGGPAGETPPVDPASIRTSPAQGVLLGAGVTLDATTQLDAKHAQTYLTGEPATQHLRIVFPAGKDEPSVVVKPAIGRWDLRDALQVGVTLRNTGAVAVTPRVRLDSNSGPTDWVTSMPLATGAVATVVVPFASAMPSNLSVKTGGNKFTSDACSGVVIGAEPGDAEGSLEVESIQVGMPLAPPLPDWLGQRPPVAGDWVKTLDDEFDGTAIDGTIWNVIGDNYWDKLSHFSKDNTRVGGGVLKLRYEHKRGFHNDDPTKAETAYATGYLDTFGKWTQRYGYFEARLKVPTAPGLWPAFWMMPDRGPAAGVQWQRQDTANGGMEFDIMEHLTRWGAYRYNIAMHYDGYGKDHKSLGSDRIYAQPDKDGFITVGLQWTPGSAVYYANGHEVLRWEAPRISNVASDLMLYLETGGWDNNALDNAQLPGDFVIDYIRVWQRKDLASDVDGKKTVAAP